MSSTDEPECSTKFDTDYNTKNSTEFYNRCDILRNILGYYTFPGLDEVTTLSTCRQVIGHLNSVIYRIQDDNCNFQNLVLVVQTLNHLVEKLQMDNFELQERIKVLNKLKKSWNKRT